MDRLWREALGGGLSHVHLPPQRHGLSMLNIVFQMCADEN